MKLSGLSNIGINATAPKASDRRNSSSEKTGSSSFEETLGFKTEAKLETPKARPPEAKSSPQAEAAKSEQPKQKFAKPEGKQETSRQETPKQNASKQESVKQDSSKQETKSEVREVKSQPVAGSVEQNVQAASADIEQAAIGDTMPATPAAPSLNGPVQEKVLAQNDSLLTASLLKQPGVKSKDEAVDSLTRRVVWNDFLRKMKEDLDVDAQDVLEAFATLSDEQLAQPPQETVNAVVANLGLDGSQAALARKYFNELVAKTKSKSMGEELATSGKQINLTLMSQRDMQRKALDRGLEQMNQNFFMKNQPVKNQQVQNMPVQTQTAQDDDMMVLGPNGLVPAGSLTEQTLSQTAAAPQGPVQALTPNAQMAALEQMNNLKPQAKPVAQEKNTLDEMVRQFLSPQAKIDTLKAGEMQAQPMAAAPAAAPAGTAATATPQAAAQAASSAVSIDGLRAILGDAGRSQDGDDDSPDQSQDVSYMNQLGIQEHGKGAMVKGAEFQSELAKAGAPQPMSVPELVDKAQIMVHDGGGEMKVTMSPDGLGEVAMRVSVNEGKVQVQMVTESDEAKRMIERHVGELKGSLTQNNLHIDSIKVDTATNLGKQLEQQYHDAQRQMAHQTLEQFRQDQQGWRRSFFEVPTAKQYKGQADAMRDVAAPGTVSAGARKLNAKRRLDLVA
jgi:flagellar hook-length control protein FliK